MYNPPSPPLAELLNYSLNTRNLASKKHIEPLLSGKKMPDSIENVGSCAILKISNVFNLSVGDPAMYYYIIFSTLFQVHSPISFRKILKKIVWRPILQAFFGMATVFHLSLRADYRQGFFAGNCQRSGNQPEPPLPSWDDRRCKIHPRRCYESTVSGHFQGSVRRVFASCAALKLGMPVYDTQCGAKLMTAEAARTAFSEKFVTRWFFDVEIMMRLSGAYGSSFAERRCFELPLGKWVDQGKSKVHLFAAFVDFCKLLSI